METPERDKPKTLIVVSDPKLMPPIAGAQESGVPFNVTVHLSFQGYATYSESEEFDQ